MNDGPRHGTAWSPEELDAIVLDYFSMLADELAGRPYVKARHNAALMALIGRSHRSVEFKHQNISAVLDELGLPWIAGYIPKPNYQNAIFDAIDRYLSHYPNALNLPSKPTSQDREEIFVQAPALRTKDRPFPRKLQRLIKKFDPVERDRRNRSLGEAGESFVLGIEQERLDRANRPDLAKRVRWIAKEEGDGTGFDIYSFKPSGSELLIEVKTTNGAARTPFFLSRNEHELATERPKEWCIYRVYSFAQQPRIFTLHPPLETTLYLSTEVWRA